VLLADIKSTIDIAEQRVMRFDLRTEPINYMEVSIQRTRMVVC
jgi:hypothetical protein